MRDDRTGVMKHEERKMKKCFLWFRHKIVYKKGYGYRCKHCGEIASKCYERG